ncbi:IEC3 subunit of the Ino80 complex, chromatin re-modelling-domain-containing protein [Parachaetomium inaequale]|uniref:IEC3 subunit of the Ino80 complex, chromatin re-modelling-domain-containing protein n=1 Tax=Parachaetomium inaequale TaxID=2588326 RepID=A0AAN6SUE5_9PEZI|nr:IEC3 subunit of the Ino80 complex, chromatin re-modelling-domain-containing protein [Parachaetomium inaequale]
MEVAARSRLDMKVKAEDDSGDARMADDKPTYRSWKKKYRKMRIMFDQKMHEGEELHRLEQKALATAKRLAVQKDRLLDLLLDVNNSGQIPPDKRIALGIDLPSDEDALFLDLDRPSTPPPGPTPAQSYKKLLEEVPHFRFSSAAERFPELLADLEAGRDSPADPAQGQSHPPSFLTADDIDNYIWELDAHLANEDAATGTGKTDAVPLPTLAPLAHADRPNPKDSQRDFAVRNPTSVYNWLRKHAPKTFLQDGEHDKDGGKENGDDGHGGGHGHGPGSGRRGKGERAPRGAGSARAKRTGGAHGRTAAAAAEGLEDAEDDLGYGGGGGGGGATTPSAAGAGAGSGGGGGKGKRKRVVDDDPGYRPKGGSSRPTKKKRKSEGAERTPTVKGSRKSEAAGWSGHSAASERSSSAKGSRKSEGAAWSGRRDED